VEPAGFEPASSVTNDRLLLDRSCHIIHPAGEVVISMRPVSVFAKGPGSEIESASTGFQDHSVRSS